MGTSTVTARATDSAGLFASDSFVVTVTADRNIAPRVVGTLSAMTVQVGRKAAQQLSGVFQDADGDQLTYTPSSGDRAKVTATATSSTVTVTGVAVGESEITITASDGRGGTASTGFVTTVTAVPQPNRRPELISSGLPTSRTLKLAGGAAQFTLAAHFMDPDGDALTYVAASTAAGTAAVAVSGGILTVTPLSEPVAAGSATISVTATDPDGESFTLTFTVTVTAVNRPPAVATPIAPVEVQLGHTATVSIAAAFTDPDSTSLEYAVTSGRTDIATAVFAGTVITIRGLKLGSATITVTADDKYDGPGRPARQTFEVTVVPGPVNQPPQVATALPDVSVTLGRTVAVNVSSAFTDPEGDSLFYRASSDAPTSRLSRSLARSST